MVEDRAVVVGLGNPGPRYAGTRHNAGFLVLDLLAIRAGGSFKAFKGSGGQAEILETRIGSRPVILMKPTTYMNESGGPVAGVARFYKVPVEHIVAVHDELDLPFGVLRLKSGGGEAGHNGLRSLVASLGSKDFARVRFGVGRPPGRQDAADYVLRDFATPERKELEFLIDRAADSVESILVAGLEAAQNEYNVLS